VILGLIAFGLIAFMAGAMVAGELVPWVRRRRRLETPPTWTLHGYTLPDPEDPRWEERVEHGNRSYVLGELVVNGHLYVAGIHCEDPKSENRGYCDAVQEVCKRRALAKVLERALGAGDPADPQARLPPYR